MTFDRFDICEAYYLFACFWHAGMGSKEYRLFSRLHKIRFVARPGLCLESLSENGQAIYEGLVERVAGQVAS